MKNIFTIAWWEVTRLRSRFGGKSKFVILPVILLAMVLSYTLYHQDFTICKGLYTIGVSPQAPVIKDSRFQVLALDRESARSLLQTGNIDLYVDADKVWVRQDLRSQYAAGALKKYLENEELSRIAGQYEVNQAFPLRITIDYLDKDPDTAVAGAEKSPSLSEPGQPASPAPQSDIAANTTAVPPPQAAPKADSPVSTPSVKQQANSAPEESVLVPGKPEVQAVPKPTPSIASSSISDAAVKEQLKNLEKTRKLPEFKAEFASENDVIVPSLMSPPMPLAQVIIAFLYIIPMFFVSVFFTSSFTEEKVNRKLVILLSAPVTRLQVIFGKMLPYYVYSILAITAVTIFLKGNVMLALSIFVPVMLFIFAIYLMVALTYRTFKDQTFFSVLALSVITVYLVVPAMFTGVNNLSFISPLTLAVLMYRGETFGIAEYLVATLPCYLTFFLVMYIGNRAFNEEFLMGFKPLHTKAFEALYLAINKKHLNISIFLLGLLLIPVVFAVQLVLIVLGSSLPATALIGMIMLLSIVIEEVAKSLGIFVLLKNKVVRSRLDIIKLACLSALGFWIGEKLLLLLTMSVSAENSFMTAVMGTSMFNGWLLFIPLVLHAVSTSVVGLLASRGRKLSYFQGILAGAVIHAIYNFSILLASGVFR